MFHKHRYSIMILSSPVIYNVYMRYFWKILPALVFWGVFAFVVWQLPYPDSLISVNRIQVLLFFIPLYLAIIFSINLLLKNFLSSGSLSLGLIFLLILKALDSFNIVTVALTVLATGLFISYFRNTKRIKLTNHSKIPKLTQLRKQQKGK